MSSQWGKNFRISIFGESHGKAIGLTMDGLPPGVKLDTDKISFQMKRRAPGRHKWATKRKEKDEFEILSGFYDGFTTGTPLCAVMQNKDSKFKDYSKLKKTPRPGHADYTGKIRYKGFNDIRGGGHFSGRLTAPLVFAGAIARQMLLKKGVIIGSHIKSIAKINDKSLNTCDITKEKLKKLEQSDFPVIEEDAANRMKESIEKARGQGDSVGGEISAIIAGVPAGIGNPIFGALESNIASLVFSVPAVKGISFGKGFDLAGMKGSNSNDEYRVKNGSVTLETNNNGGILGGITNGAPVVFTAAIKPTPSILKKQKTVDLSKMENTNMSIKGRHDPCIVPRAVPVIEACAAIALVDAWMETKKWGN